ncbi:MAG: hypothetical protein P3X22_002000 [Thermoprotei archaeon]|nr:hypothetical protein [Thermoprotei archaeon]
MVCLLAVIMVYPVIEAGYISIGVGEQIVEVHKVFYRVKGIKFDLNILVASPEMVLVYRIVLDKQTIKVEPESEIVFLVFKLTSIE